MELSNVFFCWRKRRAFLVTLEVDPTFIGLGLVFNSLYMPVEGMYCIVIFAWVDNVATELGKFSGSIPTSM